MGLCQTICTEPFHELFYKHFYDFYKLFYEPFLEANQPAASKSEYDSTGFYLRTRPGFCAFPSRRRRGPGLSPTTLVLNGIAQGATGAFS
jgi:hypothetical protein